MLPYQVMLHILAALQKAVLPYGCTAGPAQGAGRQPSHVHRYNDLQVSHARSQGDAVWSPWRSD
jgi:hypothetical protein